MAAVKLLFEGRSTTPIEAGAQVSVFEDHDGLVFVEPSERFHRVRGNVLTGMPERPSVLFLDVDGVLNRESSFRGGGGAPLEDRCVALLRATVAEVGARLVLSSSWRHTDHHRAKVFDALAGLWHRTDPTTAMSQADVNGLYHGRIRGDEITEWLSRHPDVVTYAVVDDEDDGISQHHRNFERTDFRMGLTSLNCLHLRAMLTRTWHG